VVAAYHGVELCNAPVQIPQVGLGKRDPLRERCGVTIEPSPAASFFEGSHGGEGGSSAFRCAF
jgi:hypothetical protein